VPSCTSKDQETPVQPYI